MSKKKKAKHTIKTEQEILIMEQAQKRRAEKIAIAKRKERNSKIISLSVCLLCFVVAMIVAGVSIAQMYDYETNYDKIDGEISGYERRHSSGKDRSSISFVLEISYKVGGEEYKFMDSAVYFEYVDDLVGEKTKVYVNKNNPAKAKRVITADDLSVFSVPFFAVSVVAFVFFAMICQNSNSTFKKRFCYIWFPILIASIMIMLLFWIGMPNSNFALVLSNIDGSVGYLVIACISALVSIFDGIISLKHKNKKRS